MLVASSSEFTEAECHHSNQSCDGQWTVPSLLAWDPSRRQRGSWAGPPDTEENAGIQWPPDPFHCHSFNRC